MNGEVMVPSLALLPLALASAAGAPAALPTGERDGSASTDFDGPARIRSGIAFGFSVGGGLGSAAGYPNNSQEIGDPNFYSSSGIMGGSSSTFMLMGALADYLNFGAWFGSGKYQAGEWRSSGTGVGLRVELFPLVRLYPGLAGLGLLGQFGLGSANLSSTVPGRTEAAGTQSVIGTGAFYEWSVGKILGGHFGLGPSLEYDAMWSLPFERHGLIASARVIFYGGP